MKLKRDKKFGEDLTCRFKIDIRNLTNFDLSTWKSQKVSMGSFWAKYILFELKKYRGVISHDTEEWCKIWWKTYLLLEKWHEEFGKFSPEHSKVSKSELWWNPFAQSRKCMTLKFTDELCVMTMKNYTKIEEELTCRFKIDMRNFTSFDLCTQKCKTCVVIGSLWPKYILFELQKYRGVIFHDTVMNILKKSWLVAWKMAWGIWQIFTRAPESVKIGTLMESFCPKWKIYDLEIYRGVVCHDNEELYKNWRGTDLPF